MKARGKIFAGLLAGTAFSMALAVQAAELKIGNFLDITSWDPGRIDIGFNGPYVSAVYDPLIYMKADGSIGPALATDWSYSDDQLTLTMTLREGVSFSDGEPFNAAAAAANLEHYRTASQSAGVFANVESVEVVDDYTVAINLNAPDNVLLYNLALVRSYMVSPLALADGSVNTTPVGSGPYVLDAGKTVSGSEYHFVKVEGHWDSETYPYDTVTVYPITDPTARHNAMLAGQINVNYGAAVDKDQAMMQGWNIAEAPSGWVGIQFVDRAGEILEPLADVRVRQALNYAFDGAAILNAIGNGAGVVSNQVFPASGEVNDPALDGMYAYNIERARELLAEAGYPDGFEVTMPMSPIFAVWQPAAQQGFNELGIKVTWDDMQQPDYQINAPKYPMFLTRLTADLDPAATVYRMVTEPHWYNPTPSYELYPELVELIDAIDTAAEADKLQAYRALNTKLTELAWWSVWYQPANLFFSTPDISVTGVTGYMFQPLRFIQPN